MITKPTSVEQLKDMFLELFLSTTNNVTKVAAGSVLNAVGFGVGKVSQKVLKDVAVIESNIFPEAAFGSFLDDIAQRIGVSNRFVQLASTTYVRLSGVIGTTYIAGTHSFTGKQGVTFDLLQNAVIGVAGFTYAKVVSTTLGDSSNVDPLTINEVLPTPPVGHESVLNEYKAQNGRDNESDDLFRVRIEEGVNLLATGTLSKYEQAMMKINNNVLKLYKGGFNLQGQLVLVVSTVNGTDLTANELLQLKQESYNFLSFTDQASGVEVVNITYTPIDISLRVALESTANADTVRKDMAIAFQKIIDWRFWTFGNVIEWEDLLIAAKRTRGVDRIFDGFFFPNQDIQPLTLTLPRIRGFLLLDSSGNLLSDSGGLLSPAYYPNQIDFSYQQTVLASI